MIYYEFCKSHSNQRKQNKTTLPLIGAGGPTRQRNKRERGGSPALPRMHARAVAAARLGGGAAPARRRRPASGAAWPGRGQGGPAERGCPRGGAGVRAQAARGGAKARGDSDSRRRAVAASFRPWRGRRTTGWGGATLRGARRP